MKHWCQYARVVNYLERLEAAQRQNTPTGAYLVWRDDGPWMVAGPDIDWFRGDRPPPDIEGPNRFRSRARKEAVNRQRPIHPSETQQSSNRIQQSPRTQEMVSSYPTQQKQSLRNFSQTVMPRESIQRQDNSRYVR